MENSPFEQNKLLLQLERGKVPVCVYLSNGARLTGRIKASDEYSILLLNDYHTAQLVFKHAILSIAPSS